MELSEKIQALRKERGLTQEEFAKMIFVSRTAVSKWETGRGIPSMDSLQMIAKIFNLTLDSLISADEIILVAKNENKEIINRQVFLINGIFNIIAMITLFLPLYKFEINNQFYSVPLYYLSGWLMVVYFLLTITTVAIGITQILINKIESKRLKSILTFVDSVISIITIFMLILGGQTYPAVTFFLFFIIKMILKVPPVTR